MIADFELEVRYGTGLDVEDELETILYGIGSIGSYVEEGPAGSTAHYFFSDESSRAAGLVALRRLPAVTVSAVDNERIDWLDLYEQSLTAIEVGHRFVVAPDERLITPSSDRIALVIPQERAFGTGSHETTALCLEMLEGIDVGSFRCLDVGTGSGILAIALSRLGAAEVVAFDNDTEILGVLARNARRNGVTSSGFKHFVGSLDSVQDGRLFDVTVMNIIKEVIVPLLPEVENRMRDGSLLILSGVLLTDSTEVSLAAKRFRFAIIEERSRGEWWCGLFRKEATQATHMGG
ncbi:MAG TPA: 50S ribosomal protein L11 methyltransferase [Thermoanaerobaculia bacterium]|nr:50S ribosomal protein L11 methyltransferase [Thermoanaerobaculia bacterium]